MAIELNLKLDLNRNPTIFELEFAFSSPRLDFLREQIGVIEL